MLPVCRPADASLDAKVFVLASITGLTEWVDYIPVQEVSLDSALINRTDVGGFRQVNSLSSDTGLLPFKDYIPVWVVTGRGSPWVASADGYIPMYAATGSLAGAIPYSAVVFNVDWDGTHTQQDATDTSESPHTLTWGGSANLTNAEAQTWATTSLRGNGGAGLAVTAPIHADWDFGTDDFCVEMGLNCDVLNQNMVPISTWTAGDGWWVRISAAGALEWGNANTVVYSEAIGGVYTATNWMHVAVTRDGTNLRVFVNGTQLGATVTDSTDIQSTVTLKVGDLDGQQYMLGYMSDFRITKGYARYTADFTAPTAAYPTS